MHAHPHPHPQHHHWDELPEAVQDKTGQIQAFLGDSKKARRLCRFAFHDGPHHRRTSTGVIAGIAMHLAKMAGSNGACDGDGSVIGVEFHVPPHLRGHLNRETASFKLPTRLLTAVFGDEELEEVVDSLMDGPPHDGAANLILMLLFESVYDSLNGDGKMTVKTEVIDE
jgi:hypothetical protein